jgi:hypothetical protein
MGGEGVVLAGTDCGLVWEPIQRRLTRIGRLGAPDEYHDFNARPVGLAAMRVLDMVFQSDEDGVNASTLVRSTSMKRLGANGMYGP